MVVVALLLLHAACALLLRRRACSLVYYTVSAGRNNPLCCPIKRSLEQFPQIRGGQLQQIDATHLLLAIRTQHISGALVGIVWN